MSTAISVEEVAKRFRVNHEVTRRAKYRTLRETLTEAVAAPLRNLRSGAALGRVEDFWALEDVSLEVSKGEVVGLIGRNGAGKSTLLKILTQITHPTKGRVRIWGRVGSLLEVGTGFHPELTGRENVFLNGSILGMQRREILRSFDRIVDFAGIGKFLDTPMKRYSSGMKVRLAFAVAAHLDLEVMLIDEVLAVGDAEFQRKCLGKMSDVAHSGRTVLFVSHNMAAVKSLCPRAVLLEKGRVVQDGDVDQVVGQYLKGFDTEAAARDVADLADGREGSGEVRLQRVEILSAARENVSAIPMGEDVVIQCRLKAFKDARQVFASITISDGNGQTLCQVDGQQSQDWSCDLRQNETATIECRIPRWSVAPGRYTVNIWVHRVIGRMILDFLPRAVAFDVLPADVFGNGHLPKGGYIFCQSSQWQLASGNGSAKARTHKKEETL